MFEWLLQAKRELEREQEQQRKLRTQADAFRISNNFLETRVEFLERGLEQETRQVEDNDDDDNDDNNDDDGDDK